MLLREGRQYEMFLARAHDREQWSSEQLRAYREQRLRQLLVNADRFVPYYSRLFERLEFRPGEVELPGAMSGLPYLSKHDILEAGKSLIARGRRSVRVTGSTSGTTGTPVTIVQDFRSVIRENAFIGRQLAWAGYNPGEPRVWLRGDVIVPADDTTGPYWRMNRAENMLMMSSYHLSEGNAAGYLRALIGFRPTLIQAYPSAISYLAKFLETQDQFYQSTSLRSIVTSSETLTEEVRRLIETRFRCKVFDWYGACERVAAIGTCEEGAYHLLTDYAYTELEPAGDGLFEIIGTGFNNFLMPLIRFRTGDLVELPKKNVSCECGRAFPVIKRIDGRVGDSIKLSDGRRIGRISAIFEGLTGIAEAQVVQDKLDAIRILIVPFDNFAGEKHRAILIKNARQKLGSTAEIEVEIVSDIARTSNGKFREVICNI